jgi:ubiquinone/menaquinone biosynthesis C-methylase UbiE
MEMDEELLWVKQQKWFYEFTLPDGTKTESYLQEEVRKIHWTREKALRHYLIGLEGGYSTALDISCHEGFYSTVLAEYFDAITGIDKNPDSLDKARKITKLLGHVKIRFVNSSLEAWTHPEQADFVLCFGLLYHVENPIEILRKLAALTGKAICIETQVLPFQMSAEIEDGYYLAQRRLNGLFGLCPDYSHSKEGGLTDMALIPSRDALEFLLRQFGFNKITFYHPSPDDYEQFVRHSRVIVFAEK